MVHTINCIIYSADIMIKKLVPIPYENVRNKERNVSGFDGAAFLFLLI